MKTKIIGLTLGLLVASLSLFAQEMKTEKFKVYGNCGMCETRIEKAVTELAGVTKADWDVETKMLEVSFDESKLKLDDIHQKVADVGHDTDKAKAKDEVYSSLHGCCQYERVK